MSLGWQLLRVLSALPASKNIRRCFRLCAIRREGDFRIRHLSIMLRHPDTEVVDLWPACRRTGVRAHLARRGGVAAENGLLGNVCLGRQPLLPKVDKPEMPRDDFTKPVMEALARRDGFRCSNPRCRAATVGPAPSEDLFTNNGVAAHITAASDGG